MFHKNGTNHRSSSEKWLTVIRCDIGGGKQALARPDLTVPPVLIRSIRHRNYVPSSEAQFSGFLRREIVEGLDETLQTIHHKLGKTI